MKKILWFDVETTGLDPVSNDPIQIAGMVEIDGKIEEEFNILTQALHPENIMQEALDLNGRTIEQIEGFQSPTDAKKEIDAVFLSHIDKFNRDDKFFPAGYNARFDMDFLGQWFKKLGDKYLGSFWNWRAIDPLPFLHVMDYKGELPQLQNLKLETVCEHFDIKIDAHDAMSDIKATRELVHKLGIL